MSRYTMRARMSDLGEVYFSPGPPDEWFELPIDRNDDPHPRSLKKIRREENRAERLKRKRK